MKNNIKGIIILLIVSVVWGLAFVFQSSGMDHIGPYIFNSLRFGIGAIVLIIFHTIRYFIIHKKDKEYKYISKRTVIAGLVCGVFITAGSTFQQLGIVTTDSGKAGFITALYILFVPIFGLVLKKKTPWNGWVSVVIAVVGFFFLSFMGGISNIEMGDIYLLIGSMMFACQILSVDHFVEDCDPIMISCIQFSVASLSSLILSLCTETFTWSDIVSAKWSILYTGFMSCGLAYTLQMFGQKYCKPSVASLLLSLESVFAVLGGVFILHETLSTYEIIGCCLIFGAIIFSQLNFKHKHKEGEHEEIVEIKDENIEGKTH